MRYIWLVCQVIVGHGCLVAVCIFDAYLTSQMSMKEVVILTGDKEAAFKKKLQQDLYPEVIYLAGDSSNKSSEFSPIAEGYEKEEIYICENFS